MISSLFSLASECVQKWRSCSQPLYVCTYKEVAIYHVKSPMIGQEIDSRARLGYHFKISGVMSMWNLSAKNQHCASHDEFYAFGLE